MQPSAQTDIFHIPEDHGNSRKRVASHSAQSTRSSEIGSVDSGARSASVGSRRCYSETFGDDRGDLSQEVIFGVTEAEISRRVASFTTEGSYFAEERKRFRVGIEKGVNESQKVTDRLRDELQFVEGVANSEYHEMREKPQGAE